MATTRIKDLSKTATTVASDANIVIDGSSNGTQKIARDNFRQDTADAYVAAPSTYKLAPLNGVNKIDGTYLPTSGDTPKGEWNASTNTPTLANGTGTAGDYYDVTTAGLSLGISFSVGDVVKYDGANWFKIDSVANIFDGISTVDQVKTLAQVPNVGTAANEVPVNGMLGDLAFQSSAGVVVDDLTVDGHFTGAVGKPMPVNGPSMRFDGVDDAVTFADNDAFSFTNGADDTPFSVSAWVKAEDFSQFTPIGKWQTTGREWLLYFNSTSNLVLNLRSSGSIDIIRTADAATTVNGKWIHVAVSYAGSGPNSSNAFPSAMNGVVFYIDGKPIASTASNNSSYVGMSATVATLTVGNYTSNYTKGEIRDVKLFNKELSAAEVKNVFSNGQLPKSYLESRGTAIYRSDFSGGTNGWVAFTGASIAGNIDGIGGKDDNLRLTPDTSSGLHRMYKTGLAYGRRNRLSFEYYVPSSNSNIDGFTTSLGNSGPSSNEYSATLDAWTRYENDGICDVANGSVYFYATDGGASTFTDAAGDDVIYIRNVHIDQIGPVLDARAENYNQSAGKLLDVSGNDFVGTQSGGVELLTPRSHLSAGTLDLTNLPTSATGLSAGEVYNSSGTLKIV